MEYVVGAVLTLVTVAVANKLLSKQLKGQKSYGVKYSQSHIYSVTAPMMFGFGVSTPQRSTQSNKYQESAYIKIIIVDGRAYWIKGNTFYTADIVDGTVDKESAKQVDTMSMNDVELKKMLVIVETLREENKNDSGSSGKS